MFLNVKSIKTNAKKSLYTNINGEEEKWSYAFIFVKIIIPVISCLIVYINQDKHGRPESNSNAIITIFGINVRCIN